MHTIALWANRHDYAKLILFTLAMIAYIFIVIALGSAGIEGLWILFIEFGICAVGAYWLGNWRSILVPLLAVLVAFAILVPAVGYNPALSGGDSGFIAEIPFWFGVPALFGAGVGYCALRGTNDLRYHDGS